MADPKSHGQMMNYLVRNSEDKKRMREYFETNQITTASNINRPEGAEVRQLFEDFNFRNPLADGGRIGFANGTKGANLTRRTKSQQFYIDKFGEKLLNKLSQEKFGLNFKDLPYGKEDPTRAADNFKRRLLKFEDFIKENKKQPTQFEARSLGAEDRAKTIAQTDKPEVTEEDMRNKLIQDNKKAKLFKGKIIFADENIQNEFENELKKRYSVARTSAKGKEIGVLSDKEIYDKFLKPAGYKPESTRTFISNYKKILDEDFKPLTKAEKMLVKF